MNGAMLGPYLALDNLVVAAALAPLCRDRRQVVALVAWFAGVESAAPLLGLSLGLSLGWALPGAALVETAGRALLITLGGAVAAFAVIRRHRAEPVAIDDRGIALLALLLGLDNLVAGSALSPPAALAAGLASGAAVAVAGLATWFATRGTSAVPRALVGGAALLAVGAGGLV